MLDSDLSARLKSLLLVDDPSSSKPQKNDTHSQQRRKLLVEISSTQQHTKSQETPGPSLAEQMMATTASVQKSQKEEQRIEEQKRAKNATFGMKKGFLTKDKPRKKKTSSSLKNSAKCEDTDIRSSVRAIQKQQQRQQQQRQNNLIVELDSKDDTTSPNRKPDSVTLKSNKENSSTSNSSPLYLPEVQDALSSHLQSDQSKWASPTFINSLSQHPTLSKGWKDPRYMAALESMKTHPKETMEKLKADEPEILNWLMEFLRVMGDHFVMLGDNDNGTKEGSSEEKDKHPKEEPKLLREMGPLEEKAMRRSQKVQSTLDIQQQEKSDCVDDEEVNKILSDEVLRSILLDPEMQRVMEECASISVGAGKLQYYMRHDTFGPKLRVLMKAGLLKWE